MKKLANSFLTLSALVLVSGVAIQTSPFQDNSSGNEVLFYDALPTKKSFEVA